MHQPLHNDLHSELQKYFLLPNKDKRSVCEKVLGNSEGVNRFSQFWDNAKDYMTLVCAVNLINFIQSHRPTVEEIDSYKKAQSDLALFMSACYAEIKNKKESGQ